MVVVEIKQKKIHANGNTREALVFYCEGCDGHHSVFIDGKGSPNWSWNGSLEKPTLSPSIKVTYNNQGKCCHTFVKDGMIQYLGDCYHDKKNTTIPLTEITW